MPLARATTSSEERVRRQKARIPPSRTANGRICMPTHGSRSAAISLTMPNVASGRVAERRSSSMKSNSAIRPVRAPSMASTASMNTRVT